MNAKKIFSSSHRQDYFCGYKNGQNPFVLMDITKSSLAYISGFNSGRMEYEEMNGPISKGIPKRIVTTKVLEEFLLAGLLGLSIEESEDYTPSQLNVILTFFNT